MSRDRTTKIVIADDHVMFREALSALLEATGDFEVTAQASDGEAILPLIHSGCPDVVLLDVHMPHLGGIELLTELARTGPAGTPVVIMSGGADAATVERAFAAGASGFVTKDASVSELRSVITAALAGDTARVLPRADAGLQAAEGGAGASPVAVPLDRLSAREREIFWALVRGEKPKTVAARLHISVRTVDTHRQNILKKTGARSNVDLVRIASDAGLAGG